MTRQVCIWLAGLVLLLAPVSAGSAHPEARARATLAALETATRDLDAARGARDRVGALTITIRAVEEAIGAMRAELRQAAIREGEVSDRLAEQDAEAAQLLGALQAMSRNDNPELLLHPAGAVATARAGMILADIGPEISRRAETLRTHVEEVQTLRMLQQDAASQMAEGLRQLQSARADLSLAMAERTDLPQRFVVDPTRAAILIAMSDTLEGFAAGLGKIAVDDIAPPPEDMAAPDIGSLELPVQGAVPHAAGEADAAGVSRPGILLATRPQALVTAPTAATIRYVGPLLDFGQVVILEPESDSLIVLAGLERTYGVAGQVIAAATPVGLMGGESAQAGTLTSTGGEATGPDLSETLYIEVREGNRPVDPVTWFALGQRN